MSVLVDSAQPNYGVLVLTERKETTGPFVICGDMPDDKFPIISLRRPPELCGIDEPTFDNDAEFQKWREPYIASFMNALTQTCKEHKITELGLAASEKWGDSIYATRINLKVQNILADIHYNR